MTKEQFLAGLPFKVSLKDPFRDSFSYDHEGGYISINSNDSNTYYCNVDKITKTHIHVYKVLLDKVLSTKVSLSSLHLIENV